MIRQEMFPGQALNNKSFYTVEKAYHFKQFYIFIIAAGTVGQVTHITAMEIAANFGLQLFSYLFTNIWDKTKEPTYYGYCLTTRW